MIEMEHLTRQTLYDLKTLFFNHMDFTNGQIQYDEFINNLLWGIKQTLPVKEVDLFKFDEWNQTFILDTSTNPDFAGNGSSLPEPSLFLEKAGERFYYYNDCPLPEFKEFQLILPLKDKDKVVGLLAVKEKFEGSLLKIGPQQGEILSKECTKLIEAAFNISKIARKERRYKQLFRVTEKFHSSMSMDAVLVEIIKTLQDVYPSFIYFLLLSHDNNSHENLPIKDLEYDSENIAAMQAYVTGSAQFEHSSTEKTCILYAPLKGKQGVYGVLQVIAPNSLVFPQDEVEFITLLANTAGSALENAQLYHQSKRLISDLQLINETSHRLNANLRLSETMIYMKRQIARSFSAQEVGFITFLADGSTKPLTGSTGLFESSEAEWYITYLTAKITIEKESLFIGDLNLQNVNEEVRYRSLMAVPMVQNNALTGFAVVLHEEPYFFSFEMFKLLQSLIHHSSMAVANSLLREELEKMVITDHLTRLYSRNYLDQKIHQSMEEDAEGTFILIDIDNFKKVNDTYGHVCGDLVLKEAGAAIRRNIRTTDVVVRLGGEEFAVISKDLTLEEGIAMADRVVREIEKLNVIYKEKAVPVTTSAGIAIHEGETIQAFIDKADRALYEAKRTGRNRLVVS
jgi:diguanylate cyclase (GGDEF)-like protein